MNETHASVEQFELNKHAVIEASAGTGKTYTIERLVERILIEENVPFDHILVVTFTEKATGELKTRLRKKLEDALQNYPEHAAILTPAVDQFDQAPIFTIHGFCQRLLQEYAIEQGQDFRTELVDDVDLLRTLLCEIQRKDWRRAFGSTLRDVLERAGYSRETAEAWDRKVLEIAKRYKPRSGHQTRPAFDPEWWRKLDQADAAPAGQLELFTVDALHRRLREYKRQRGLLSFDDMIAAVEENLDPDRNQEAETFLNVLRRRYRFGIVDEFQDTDPLQWRIFRRIFCEGGDSRLFIVGDPKQAIFGFRGADLPTYLLAAEEMKTQFGASLYPLQVNWRSEPDLLEGLNCIFGDGDWFPKEFKIEYRPVFAPDDDKRQSRLIEDQSNRAAITLVDVTQIDRIKLAGKHFARFIAFEISRLLNHGKPLLTLKKKGCPAASLNAGDFCVLVMKRADADPVTQALDAAGIPYSFYKQTGLWQTDEAFHVQTLLETLARPDDRSAFRKALLTCFFRVAPADLALAPDVPMQHPARQLYQTWLAYVENREWSALFRSLLEDTGLFFPSSDQRCSAGSVDVLCQLFAALEQAGHAYNLDLLGLLEWIRRRRDLREASEPEMRPEEAGRPRVKIMTIHASKGLEFPIVFVAGGFTKGRHLGSFTTYRDHSQRLVFDLTPDDESQANIKADALDEQRRLFYVALTRPIFKLYLPKVKIPRSSGGYLGPIGTILHPALEQACPDKLGPLIADVVAPPLTTAAPAEAATAAAEPAKTSLKLKGPLFPSYDTYFGKRRIVVRSFSSMSKHHLSTLGEGASFGEQTPVAEDEALMPSDHDDPLRGPVFGDMVHKVLETIDFAEVGRAKDPDSLVQAGTHARKVIDREIQTSIALLRSRVPIDQLGIAARQQIATLVWHSLRTPLAELGGPLCEISASDRRPEIDFLFPEELDSEDARHADAFITGFMDLLFRKNGKYYLLDWKTNLLPAYTREHLERSMTESDYHRQYRLYLHAVARWLARAHGSPGAFTKHFGGVYYLYVRGLNGRDESTGVFFQRPTEKDLKLDAILARES